MVPSTESDEYVEIANLGNAAQQLLEWQLVDLFDGGPTITFSSRILNPGEAIRVYTNEVHPEWGGFSFGHGSAIWNNSQPDMAALYNQEGALVSTKSYPPGCE